MVAVDRLVDRDPLAGYRHVMAKVTRSHRATAQRILARESLCRDRPADGPRDPAAANPQDGTGGADRARQAARASRGWPPARDERDRGQLMDRYAEIAEWDLSSSARAARRSWRAYAGLHGRPGRAPRSRDHDCGRAGCKPHACKPMTAGTIRNIHSILSGAFATAKTLAMDRLESGRVGQTAHRLAPPTARERHPGNVARR